jgi:hypothetical protein
MLKILHLNFHVAVKQHNVMVIFRGPISDTIPSNKRSRTVYWSCGGVQGFFKQMQNLVQRSIKLSVSTEQFYVCEGCNSAKDSVFL